jgi:hypothetical protein
MSSYSCKIRVKKTGEIYDAYTINNSRDYTYLAKGKIFKEEEVEVLPLKEKKSKKCKHNFWNNIDNPELNECMKCGVIIPKYTPKKKANENN